jgi:hypothetical protein
MSTHITMKKVLKTTSGNIPGGYILGRGDGARRGDGFEVGDFVCVRSTHFPVEGYLYSR